MDRRMDKQMERQTEGGDNNIPFAFLKKRGDKYVIWQTPVFRG